MVFRLFDVTVDVVIVVMIIIVDVVVVVVDISASFPRISNPEGRSLYARVNTHQEKPFSKKTAMVLSSRSFQKNVVRSHFSPQTCRCLCKGSAQVPLPHNGRVAPRHSPRAFTGHCAMAYAMALAASERCM